MRGCETSHKLSFAQDDGFSLIELLVATVIALIATGGVLVMLDAVTRSSANDQERGSALTEESSVVHYMVEELDQAFTFNGPVSKASANYVDLDLWVIRSGSSKSRRVVFDCEIASPISGERECVRYEMPVTDNTAYASLASDPSASSRVLIPRVVNGTSTSPVFELKTPRGGTTPTYGEVTLETPAAGQRAGYEAEHYSYEITLHDSFTLRNLTLRE